ncbi:MAG: MgtC/SapB family protein [Ignavibacteriae bacterium]|nr:MgtC/SapB family protein [Ignavibacteriota bacterium]
METWAEFRAILPDLLFKSIAAIVCGGLIGGERERKGKPAGLRTNILICLGSSLYMLVGEYVLKSFGVVSDPTRIASQVVTGIGFIGAGTIIQSRGTISGLTTAAVIWTVSAIGLCIGAGFPFIAMFFTLLVLFVLTFLSQYEHKLLGKCHFVTTTLKFQDDEEKVWMELSEILSEYDVTTTDFEIKRENGSIVLDLKYCDKHPAHSKFMYDLWKASSATGVIASKNLLTKPKGAKR